MSIRGHHFRGRKASGDSPLVRAVRSLRKPAIGLLCVCGLSTASAQFDRILGEFTIQRGIGSGQQFLYFAIDLDYDKAPQAVANFIRLVEGSRPWVDSESGEVRSDPFFDGTEINFVFFNDLLLFGSRTGDPDDPDDPGYFFPDDLSATVHDPFSVYMAKDALGNPNTNGSRIFITIPQRPELAATHTRIGSVVNFDGTFQNGREVVAYLSQQATDADRHPVTRQLIESVTIRREIAAPLFDEDAYHLPEVAAAKLRIVQDGPDWRLRWSDTAGSIGTWFATTDPRAAPADWIGPFTGSDPPGEGPLGGDISVDVQFSPRTFYRGHAATYPFWPGTGLDLAGTTIQLNYQEPFDPLNYVLLLIFDPDDPATGDWSRFVLTTTGAPLFLEGGLITDAAHTVVSPFRSILSFQNGTDLPFSQFILHHDSEDGEPKVPNDPSRFEGGESATPTAPAGLTLIGSWVYGPTQ